jgi:gamma-glutamyltranspeptidase / glutathione hydrolase
MRRWAAVSSLSALAAVLLAVPAQAGAAAAAPGATAPAAGTGGAGGTKEPVAVGTGGAVASMDLGASQAGITALQHGGNAIDAAVATASALGVTIPFVAGPGGGGFMVIYLARTHQVVTIDGRENCPQACTTTMFIDPKTGQPYGYDYA